MKNVPGEDGTAEPTDPSPMLPVSNIEHITPPSGPICGGIEVSVIGSGFPHEHPCTFGGSVAATIRQTEILCLCLLPPSETPGPVKVLFEGVPSMGTTQTFTYLDTRENEACVCSSGVYVDLHH